MMPAWRRVAVFGRVSAFLASLVMLAATVEGQSLLPRHTLFNPTPTASMREMATDRPDQTESPYTVDAGHFQLEVDFVSLSLDRGPDGVSPLEAWSLVPLNLKVGLLDRADLQLIVEPVESVRVSHADRPGTRLVSGFGNITSRLKVNFWGNDGGRTAFGLMAFVRWPLPASSIRTGRTEWGLIFPLAVGIAEGWSLGAMSEVDVLADPGGGHDVQIVNSVTVGHELTQKLGMYAEVLAGRVSNGSRWFGQVDVGWTYGLRENVQLDCGANVGLTGSVPALQPFAGLSVRF